MRIFLSLALLFSFSVVAQESTEYKYEVESNKAEYYIGSYKKGKDVEDLPLGMASLLNGLIQKVVLLIKCLLQS